MMLKSLVSHPSSSFKYQSPILIRYPVPEIPEPFPYYYRQSNAHLYTTTRFRALEYLFKKIWNKSFAFWFALSTDFDRKNSFSLFYTIIDYKVNQFLLPLTSHQANGTHNPVNRYPSNLLGIFRQGKSEFWHFRKVAIAYTI